MRSHPIDDQSNHHLPIASLQATVANIMGGNRRVSDFLIFGDRGSGEGGGGSDSEIEAILRANDFEN